MWQQKFRRLLLIIKGIIGKWWTTIIGKYKVMQQRKLIRFSLLPIGIIGVLVIIIVVPFSYTPDTSIPFPYIPPPEGDEGYYIGTTVGALTHSFQTEYTDPFDVEGHIGLSFIFWDVLITTEGLSTLTTEAYLRSSLVKFVPQDHSELEGLKAGDMVDITGVCTGMEEFPTVIVFKNCQFLPRGVAPLPLPGAPLIMPEY